MDRTSETTQSTMDTTAAALSVVTVVTAALGVAAAVYGTFDAAYALGAAPVVWFSVVLAVLHLGQIAAAIALWRTGLAGTGALARAGLGLWLLGGLAYVVGELLYLTANPLTDAVFGVASLASGVGPILAGIAVLRVGRWTGPGRFLPLAIGVYVFVVLTPVLFATSAGLLAVAGWNVLWLLLGLALYARARVAR